MSSNLLHVGTEFAMLRRDFLKQGFVGGGLMAVASLAGRNRNSGLRDFLSPVNSSTNPLPRIHSITPVVGDGRWVWNQPPEQTGYLEPRDYELEISIRLEGTGPAQLLKSTTPVPVDFPEQKIVDREVESRGCQAIVRTVSKEAGQLMLAAPFIAKGQTISATSRMRLTLFKQYQGYAKEQFRTDQPEPPITFKRQYLFNSPGIQTRSPQVRKLKREIIGDTLHPWDMAYKIYQWVWENIEAKEGIYTDVVRAIRNRSGDCEERAACFVALCRASGIPARVVWIPNHNWAEFFLVDLQGVGHWIPAHTAAYSWFGWTGVHELILQKGDNLFVPEKRQPQRLLADWMQWKGARPKVRYAARIRPLPSDLGGDPGPGERIKDDQGKWVLQRSHNLDRSLRDGRSPGTRRYPQR